MISYSRTKEQHNYGASLLRLYFGYQPPPFSQTQRERDKPVRLHPNTPPVRDAEHKIKHKKRKAAKLARRKNRARH